MNQAESLKVFEQTKDIQSQQCKLDDIDKTHKQEPQRFVNTILFLICCLISAIPSHSLTPINSVVQKTFGYSKIQIAANSLMFSISHPILAFVANGILDKYGLKIGTSIGILSLTIGVWLRVLIDQSMVPVLIGSFMAAFGNIFIINSPSKFATTWFRPTIVPRITALGVLSTMASLALGIVIPPLFVHSSSTKNDIVKMLVYQAVIVSIPSVLMIFFFKDKPSQPPSFAANVQHSRNYKQDLKDLFKNKNYLLLLLAISVTYGGVTCFITVIQFLILPFNYNEPSKLASILLFSSMIAGGISSFFFMTVFKRTRAYKKILITAMVGVAFQIICFVFALDSHKLPIIIIIVIQSGFFMVPQIPIILDLGCQLAFPIGQASSSGFLIAGAQLTGFLTSLLALNFLDTNKRLVVYIVVGCLSLLNFIGALAVFLLKQDLQRTNFEKSKIFNELSQSQKRNN